MLPRIQLAIEAGAPPRRCSASACGTASDFLAGRVNRETEATLRGTTTQDRLQTMSFTDTTNQIDAHKRRLSHPRHPASRPAHAARAVA